MTRQAAATSGPGRRILFFVSSMNAGGAERVAATLANAWAARGDEVCLVLTHLGSEGSFYTLDERVHCVALRDWVKPGPWPALVRKWRAIRAVYRHFKPAIVLSFLTNVNVNVLWALRKQATPIIVSERTHPLHSQSAGSLLRWARRWLYRRAARVVLQTGQAAQDFGPVLRHSHPLVVIPNPLPADLLPVAPAWQKRRPGPPHVVALGRLVPVKRFEVLIEAFARLPAQFAAWQLFLYGEGPQRQELEARIRQLGLQQRVHLRGNTAEPWQALQQADVFVLCSAYEGFPNALLEAMYIGLPCVVVDCPSGPAELSEQGQVARLLPAGATAQMLAEALAGLMADEPLRHTLGERARASVARRFRQEQVLSQWEALFEQLAQ